MGFPIGYTNLLIPRLLLQVLTLLSLFRNLVYTLLNFLGLQNFLEPEPPTQPDSTTTKLDSFSAGFIRELLPVVKFSDLVEQPEKCVVCLYEFQGEDEIRSLINCSHVFHRTCLDRWLEYNHKTCPLCRRTFVPEDMQQAFNDRIWLASGISDFYQDFSPIPSGL